MCGRYTLSTPADLIREHFDLPESPTVRPRYNIAPSQETLVIGRRGDRSTAAGMAVWGLSGRYPGAKALINARIETAHQKPSFRDAFERRRCLVPADGFFEWRKDAGGKTPCYFHLRSGDPFAFAGIWNRPLTDGEPITFALLTTVPNEVVQPVHQRMPVILSRTDCDLWLAKRALAPNEAECVARPFPAELMRSYEVSTLVNSPANDTLACVAPATAS